MTPGAHLNIPYPVYDAEPGIRSGTLKRFRVSPASVLMPRKETEEMVLGSAVDSLILCGEDDFHERFVVEPEFSYDDFAYGQKKKGVEKLKAAFAEESAGKLILPAKYAGTPTLDVLQGMRDSVLSHPYAAAILSEAQTQVTLIWDDSDTGERCKARLDMNPGRKVIAELKMTNSIDRFMYVVRELGYAIQVGFYTSGCLANEIPIDAAVFIIVEPRAPYRSAVWTMPGIDDVTDYNRDLTLDYGLEESRRLVRLYAECRAANFWPSWRLPEDLQTLADLKPEQLTERFGQRRAV